MPMIKASAPAAVLLLATLSGCLGVSSYSEDAPAGYSIAGTWTLNPAQSTDARKALEALRADQRRSHADSGDSSTELPPIDTRPTSQQDPMGTSLGVGMNTRDHYRPPLDVQTEVLKGGDLLRIRQEQEEVVISNELTSHSFTPGSRSVVSVPSGVADQSSGWKGRSYVVEIVPQVGPRVRETYALAANGQQLIVTINVGSEGGNKSLKVTRVYDRGTGAVQNLPVQ
jgi:hypothetical protein